MVKQVRGGVKASEPVPTAVAILIQDYPSCSGTILSNFWVATAGHCFQNVPASDLKVVAGVVSLLSDEAIKVGVKRIVKHPSYKIIENDEDELKVLDWDLALLELEESLKIGSNEMISEAKLPPPAVKHHGKPVIIGGWGRTDEFSAPSFNHLSINVTIKTTEDCLKTHPVSNFHEDRMFCAGTESETTCPGDSTFSLYLTCISHNFR
jgi:secreted trypsin-like serine protease